MTHALQTTDKNIYESLALRGDLSLLKPEEKAVYLQRLCESMQLNPLTQPFIPLKLNGKEILYASRGATDQLASNHKLTREIIDTKRIDDVYIVTCKVTAPDGRFETGTGAVALGNLKGDALANALMKAECVPLDSEILTREGWKKYNEIFEGQEVLAYDCETDSCVWTELEAITVHESLPMARLFSDKGQFEVFCTPNHSWAVSKPEYKPRPTNNSRGKRGEYANRKPDRFLIEAHKINTSHRIILAAPQTELFESVLTPVEAAILGWAVTDGTIQESGRIGICQSKEENFPIIRETVNAIAKTEVNEVIGKASTRTFPSGNFYTTKPPHWWYLPTQVSRDLLQKAGLNSKADLPKLVTRLSTNARQAMLQAMMLADGDKRGNFYKSHREVLDAFQILCALEGFAVGRETSHQTVTKIRKKKTRHVAGKFLNLEIIGEQPAWCPTTRFGTWVMRQNGRVMITGNTKAKRRATLSFCGLGFMDESELETIPANRIERDRRPAAEPKQITAASVEIIDAEPLLPDHPTEAAESLYLQLDELYTLENNPNKEKALANFAKLQTLTEKENVLAEVRQRVETALREKVKAVIADEKWPYMPDKTVEYLASFGIDAIDKAEIPALKKALESFAEDGIL